MATFFRMDKRTINYALSYLDILLRQGVIRTIQSSHSSIYAKSEYTSPRFAINGLVCSCLLIASKFNDAYDIIRAQKLVK